MRILSGKKASNDSGGRASTHVLLSHAEAYSLCA